MKKLLSLEQPFWLTAVEWLIVVTICALPDSMPREVATAAIGALVVTCSMVIWSERLERRH